MNGAGTSVDGGCGYSALSDAPVARGAEEPARSCGQDAAEFAEPTEPAQTCGQGALEPADFTESAGPAEPSQDCGQGALETVATCGQGAVEPTKSIVSAEPAAACGQDAARPPAFHRLDATEMAAWRAFLAASTAVTARLNRELEVGTGISMHEYEILVRLFEAEDHSLRMSALADHVSHSRSRLTHTVSRLEKAGYVERSSCAADRRGVDCRLTGAGVDFLRTAAPIHLGGVRRHVVDRFSHEQLEELTGLLIALVDEA